MLWSNNAVWFIEWRCWLKLLAPLPDYYCYYVNSSPKQNKIIKHPIDKMNKTSTAKRDKNDNRVHQLREIVSTWTEQASFVKMVTMIFLALLIRHIFFGLRSVSSVSDVWIDDNSVPFEELKFKSDSVDNFKFISNFRLQFISKFVCFRCLLHKLHLISGIGSSANGNWLLCFRQHFDVDGNEMNGNPSKRCSGKWKWCIAMHCAVDERNP